MKTFAIFALKVAGAMILVEVVDSFTGIFTTVRTTVRSFVPARA